MVDLGAKEKSAPGKVALMVLMVGMTGFEPATPAPESFVVRKVLWLCRASCYLRGGLLAEQ
jgi:hypothetical protein